MPTHPLEGHRDGDTFDPEVDLKPLNDQMIRVWYSMSGRVRSSIQDICNDTGDPGASVSARIRDFRKAKFGGHTVERTRIGRTWYYTLYWNLEHDYPTDEEIERAFRNHSLWQ